MPDTNENTQDPQQQINRHFLRYLRENAKLTHEQLAQEIGVETELAQHWETGRRQPSQRHQFDLEKLFGIETGALCLEIQQLLIEDFNAAYFGDEDARARIDWVDEKKRLAQVLSIIPSTKRLPTAELITALLEELL
ncbi:MAG: helix-turn-helix transcriptional regulator [Candidatus Poribacteria bacterium]|nr:helix-turn-helix transcriptional regulator [Candidatus Poribacteria bacterium]